MSDDKQVETAENTTSLRSDLIDKAVKFLLDGRVNKTQVEEKKTFLKNKGLTDEEINEAFSMVNKLQHSSTRYSDVSNSNLVKYFDQNTATSSNSKWKDYAGIALLAGGATFLTVNFVKNYIMPKWFGTPTKQQQKMQVLQDSMSEVQNGLKFLVDSVQQTFTVVQKQQELSSKLLHQLTLREDNNTRLERSLYELKNEMSVIKSLLLSRDQFPPVPVNKPSLPAWQQLKRNNSEATNFAAGDAHVFVNGNKSEDENQNVILPYTNGNGIVHCDEEDDLNRSIFINPDEKMTPV